jgi:Epoxide hydrolase N terminus
VEADLRSAGAPNNSEFTHQGKIQTKMEFKEIIPFAYHAPQNVLDDLKQRLTQARWPEHETTNDWSEGVPLDKLRMLVEYWRTIPEKK